MSRYRCHTCAAEFKAWAPCERHADAEHHHRFEVLVAELDETAEGADNTRGLAPDITSSGVGPGSQPRPRSTHPGT